MIYNLNLNILSKLANYLASDELKLFSNTSFEDIYFSGYFINNFNCRESNLNKSQFNNCKIDNTNITNSTITEVNFYETSANSFEIKGCNAKASCFDKAKISNGSFNKSDFSDSSFVESEFFIQEDENEIDDILFLVNKCNFKGSNFCQSMLLDVESNQCNFNNVDFSLALVERCEINNADFTNSDFSYSTLVNSEMNLCNFNNVDFKQSKISNNDFKRCSFINSDFYKSELTDANFDGSILIGAKNLNKDIDLTEAITTVQQLRELLSKNDLDESQRKFYTDAAVYLAKNSRKCEIDLNDEDKNFLGKLSLILNKDFTNATIATKYKDVFPEQANIPTVLSDEVLSFFGEFASTNNSFQVREIMRKFDKIKKENNKMDLMQAIVKEFATTNEINSCNNLYAHKASRKRDFQQISI